MQQFKVKVCALGLITSTGYDDAIAILRHINRFDIAIINYFYDDIV